VNCFKAVSGKLSYIFHKKILIYTCPATGKGIHGEQFLIFIDVQPNIYTEVL